MASLVEAFSVQAADITNPAASYTEADLRLEFIDKFFKLLGWDVGNDLGVKQRLREVVVERTLDNDDGATTGRPDYRLRVNGRDRLPVEAKRANLEISSSVTAARQARTYGWSLSLPAAILTNFSETIVYATSFPPEEGESAAFGVVPGCHFVYSDYIDRFDELWRRLSFESVSRDTYFAMYDFTEAPRGMSPFDESFLAAFRHWRLVLARDVARNNVHLVADEVGRRVQRFLNAVLFLRVCEDRGIGRYEDLSRSADQGRVVERFREADIAFNAGLFDVLSDTTFSSDAVARVIRALYWPYSKFAFGVVTPETFAGLYEQYLGHRVEIGASRSVELVPKPEVAHDGGVVPTPQFIVAALLDLALDPMIANDADFERCTLLDPACGSGIFLVSAFSRLIERYEDNGQECGLRMRGEVARRHLFGVDIDAEAVEVARLSVLLSVLGDDHLDVASARHVLPDLRENIRVGNSLIDQRFDEAFPDVAAIPELRRRVSPFNWSVAFPEVFGAGGFCVIVGNPPYQRIQLLADSYPEALAFFQDESSGYLSSRAYNFDTYLLFIERALQLLSPIGRLAFIIPSRFMNSMSGAAVRELLSTRLEHLVYFGEAQVFAGRSTYTCLISVGPQSSDDVCVEIVHDLVAWRVEHV